MILVLGVGVVGKAVIEYFQGKQPVCFYDDNIDFLEDTQFFKSWDDIDLVVVSPGVELRHHMMQEAIRRNIKITNDVEIFIEHQHYGKKIAITGTNGKSTACALLQNVLEGCEYNGKKIKSLIGGNFGVSPLTFLTNNEEADFYIIELSSYQLELMDPIKLHAFDVGIITNIYPNHLNRHGDFDDYVSAKCKILGAKHKLLGKCDLFKDWEFKQARLPDVLPKSDLFKKEEYQYCWNIIENVLEIFDIDKNAALAKAVTYAPLPYRQELICTEPIKIINDSKGTTPIATLQAIKNVEGAMCWIAGGYNDSDRDWSELVKFADKLKKVYLAFNNQELIEILINLNIDFIIEPNLELAAKGALEFALENKLTVLFSPGYQSFNEFKNFNERGAAFNGYIKKYLSS